MRKFFKEEGAKLKEMNFTDKRQYIWEYYKLHIFVIGFAIIFIGGLINVWFINPPKRDYLYIAWQAWFVPPEQLEELSQRLNVIVENQERYQVSVRSYVLTGEPQMDQAIVTRFHAMLSVGDVHAIVIESATITEYAEVGMIMPVHELVDAVRDLSPALYNDITNRIRPVTYTPRDEDTPVTDMMAISLYGAPLLTELEIISTDLYLGVLVNTNHFYELAKILQVLFYEGAG